MLKLKLIFPCKFETYDPYGLGLFNFPPYGMGILTAFLKQNNSYIEQEDLSVRFNWNSGIFPYRFTNLDLDLNRNLKEINRFLKSGDIEGKLGSTVNKIFSSFSLEGFDAVGFSIYTYFHFTFALMLAKKIKQRTKIPIVFGGAFSNFFGHFYPEAFNIIDYMIIGDGSIPLFRLIEYLKHEISISSVPNLIYRDSGKLVVNRRIDYPLENIPIPDYEGLPLHIYAKSRGSGKFLQSYQVTRGCINKCSFCNRNYLYGKLEFKSFGKVINELGRMKEKYKNKAFFFCDDAINNSYEYLEGLCDLFIKNKLDIHWYAYASPNNLDKRILRKMKEAGCALLSFGIESGSDRILTLMNKGFTSEQASKTLMLSYQAGLRNRVFFMVGYPHETQADINQTAEFIRRNRKYIHLYKINIFNLVYGSPIYFHPESYGITNLLPKYLSYNFCFDEINGLIWEEKKKQQEDSEKQIMKAAFDNMRIGLKLKIILSPYFMLIRQVIVLLKNLWSSGDALKLL